MHIQLLPVLLHCCQQAPLAYATSSHLRQDGHEPAVSMRPTTHMLRWLQRRLACFGRCLLLLLLLCCWRCHIACA
jgi:hypothetical protein